MIFMSLTLYETVLLHGYKYNILQNNNILIFDLFEFALIHEYPIKYLVNYYGKTKKYIKIYDKKYTDWNGMIILCIKARHDVIPSFNTLETTINKNITDIKIPLSDERNYIKQIKEYFGNRYKYIEQLSNKKLLKTIKSSKYNSIIFNRYRIDLVIMKQNEHLVFIEIDEEHHKYQKTQDQLREDQLLLSYNCNLVRLKLYDKSFNFQNSLNEIDALLNN